MNNYSKISTRCDKCFQNKLIDVTRTRTCEDCENINISNQRFYSDEEFKAVPSSFQYHNSNHSPPNSYQSCINSFNGNNFPSRYYENPNSGNRDYHQPHSYLSENQGVSSNPSNFYDSYNEQRPNFLNNIPNLPQPEMRNRERSRSNKEINPRQIDNNLHRPNVANNIEQRPQPNYNGSSARNFNNHIHNTRHSANVRRPQTTVDNRRAQNHLHNSHNHL